MQLKTKKHINRYFHSNSKKLRFYVVPLSAAGELQRCAAQIEI